VFFFTGGGTGTKHFRQGVSSGRKVVTWPLYFQFKVNIACIIVLRRKIRKLLTLQI